MTVDSVRRYWRELFSILLGFVGLVASVFYGGVLLPIAGLCFLVGGLLQLPLRYSATHSKLYVAISALKFLIPAAVMLVLGAAFDQALSLALGAFFLTLGGMLLIGFATDVETRRLTPVTFLVFAAIMLLLEQLLAAVVLGGFVVFTAYRVLGPTSAGD